MAKNKYVQLKIDGMIAATPVEKKSSIQQAEKKKKKKQAEPLPLLLPVIEHANSQTQKLDVPKAGTSSENSNKLSSNNDIPAVHGSQPAYAQGSELMYTQLQASLQKTGDLNHPDTQKKEMDYKMTLGVNDLRDYHDIKSGNSTVVAETSKKAETPKSNPEAASEVKTPEIKTQGAAAVSQSVSAVTAKPEITATAKTPDKNTIQQPAEIPVAGQEAVPDVPKTATGNPAFVDLQGEISTTAKAQKQHDPATKSSQDAQAAALSPANERESMAQAGQVDVMDAQEAGKFSAEDFKAELMTKIASMKLPKDEEEADDFDKHNNIKQVNESAVGDVKKEKNAAAGNIAKATSDKPNTAAQPVRKVANMPTPNHGKAPAVANAGKAMPVKRDAAAIEQPIQAQTDGIDNQMKENGVTDNMLANSNEPSFTSALDQKNKAKADSKAATTQFRQTEGGQLSQTRNEAQQQAAQQIGGMHGVRKGGLDKVHGNQTQTADKDTKARKEIADHINGIYNTSKAQVDDILKNLDAVVAYKFTTGANAAKYAFEKHVADEMAAYKKERYGDSWLSWKNLKRVKDAFVGLPKEVNKFFVTGKDLYIKTMGYYITDIANYVAAQLNAAKAKIASGKKAVQQYVNSLSLNLRKLGKDAIMEIQTKFNALEETVNNKKDALIDVLAKKYSENVAAIDKRIESLKAANSGLVSLALNALTGVFAFIIDIKNKLMSLLAKVADVVMAIITDPIGFFKNLIAGVGQGFSNFTTNIWTHLKTGFFTWLTGSMQGVAFTMPEDPFSIKGVFSIAMQVLGIGWEGIRAIGATVVGEPIMQALETGEKVVQVIRKDGIAGLWEYLKDQFQDLKATVMDAIMDIIQNQVIQAGVKWILGLLSPVGAFVKAIMAIIDVVKFFVERAAQIADLINAFLDSVSAIASGKVGAVAKSIENALAKAIPVLIGLLASVLGISGLVDKVLGVIKKIRQRITAGITKFWNFVKEKGKKLLGKIGIGEKKDKKGKGKVEEKHVQNMDSEIAPEPFTMNGKTHTLTFEKGEIYMATDKDQLVFKINRSLKYIDKNPDAPELNGKAVTIAQDIGNLKTAYQETKTTLTKAKNLPNADAKKTQRVEDAQKTLDDLSAKISHIGTKYKLLDLAGEYETKEVGDKGLKVGLHPLSGPNRQSHHVPEKELKNALTSFYSNIGKKLILEPHFKDLGTKLVGKKTEIDAKFNSNGDKLPAILIDKKTHKDGGTSGVHNIKAQPGILDQITKTTENDGGYRTVIYDNKEERLVASIKKHHYEGFISKMYGIIKGGKDSLEIIKGNKDEVIIKSDTHTPNATGLIANSIGKEIRDLFYTFEKEDPNGSKTTVLDEGAIRKQKSEILENVNNTTREAFKHSLNNSIDALRTAMESNKESEGDEKTRNDALKKMRALSTDVWSQHVYNPIK